jgi:hypothetical protein
MTEDEAIGKAIASLLRLKKTARSADGRYKTAWGNKTTTGLAMSVQRVIADIKAEYNEGAGA